MFKIELVDIGGDGCVAEGRANVDTLVEAEIVAKETIRKALRTRDIELVYDDDMIYEVMHKGESIGCVAITSL